MTEVPTVRTFILFVLGALLVGACASATAPRALPSGDVSGQGSSAPGAVAGEPVAGPVAQDQSDRTAADQAVVDPEARFIVRVGTLALEVSDVQAAYRQVRQIALKLGGYVGDSQFANDVKGNPTATVVLRIPVDRYEDALAALRPLATKVAAEQSKETDVTSQIVDLDARLTNLRATEAALQKLFDRAEKISDILEVQRELSSVREQIERLAAERQMLFKQAELATLTVTLEMPAAPITAATKSWDLGGEIQQALAQLLAVGQDVARALIWLAIVILPVLVVALVLVAIAWRLVRRLGLALPRRPVVASTPPEVQ